MTTVRMLTPKLQHRRYGSSRWKIGTGCI